MPDASVTRRPEVQKPRPLSSPRNAIGRIAIMKIAGVHHHPRRLTHACCGMPHVSWPYAKGTCERATPLLCKSFEKIILLCLLLRLSQLCVLTEIYNDF